ncbi:MAG: hypothetical protein ACXVC0_04090 [Bdellovibrionota bacterium]
MKILVLTILLLPSAAFAVAPSSPASCKMVSKSKLGEHLRETAWDLTRTRTKLNRDLSEHNRRCALIRGDLTETRQLTEIERVGEDTRRANAELLDLADEYLRTLQTDSEAAHLLREDDCRDRLLEQRHDFEEELTAKGKEVAGVLSRYCR